MVALLVMALVVGVVIVSRRSGKDRALEGSAIVGICKSCGAMLSSAQLAGIHRSQMRIAVLNGLFASRHPRRLTMPQKLPCPACQSRSLVPIDTPIGRKLLDKHHP